MKMVKIVLIGLLGCMAGVVIIISFALYRFESSYHDRVYPGIVVGTDSVEGFNSAEIVSYFNQKSAPLAQTLVQVAFEDQAATFSGTLLELKYDGDLAASQALSHGRSGNTATDLLFRLRSFIYSLFPGRLAYPLVQIPLLLSYRSEPIDEALELLATHIDSAPVEPLFEINPDTGRVTAFKLGKNGRALNMDAAKKSIIQALNDTSAQAALTLQVDTVHPKAKTDDIEELGIVELIGTGESFYTGSIPGRVHNILLATSRTSGIIVAPGEVFSFNEAVGDISAATGYKSAYIIKNGRTMLGDGGGVCQVSTTLFRAAMNAGLDIIERNPHSYRVTYYELGGYKPGLDATVYYPTVDLKFVNNTNRHILITSTPDDTTQKLTFNIYGKADGRTVEISDVSVSGQSPPPPPVYQEDPTLPTGEIKQVDWAAYGAKAIVSYKVTRGKELLTKKSFISNFRPWQAVYLYGPGTPIPGT